jgi:signal transduction histidine kinase/ActR/RegA family two-component response regulator
MAVQTKHPHPLPLAESRWMAGEPAGRESLPTRTQPRSHPHPTPKSTGKSALNPLSAFRPRVARALSGVRLQLMGAVFLLVTPAALLLYILNLPWGEFTIGLLALIAAWVGGEFFVMRQVRHLIAAAKQLQQGDLTARTGIADQSGEMGELARNMDEMADALQGRETARQRAEHKLLVRAQQQSGSAALGQLALATADYDTLVQQAVSIIAHSLDVEFCDVLAVENRGRHLRLLRGHGWKLGNQHDTEFLVSPVSLTGFVFTRNEPTIVTDWDREKRFRRPDLFVMHQVRSSACVPIRGRTRTFGLLSVHSTLHRDFTGDDLQFLMASANHLATAGDRLQAEAEMQTLASFAQLNPNAILELAPDATVTYCNEAALNLALKVDLDHPHLLLPPNIQDIIRTALANQRAVKTETTVAKHDLEWEFQPIPAAKRVHCYIKDVTEQKSLQAQLRQSQKMDSLGHLAAGVAHDFNNMLTVIQGHTSMLISRLHAQTELQESAQCVHFAAERAATLTKQLLVFGRKSVFQPKLLDLGECVGHLAQMLKRLLGERIELCFTPPSNLPLVRGDVGLIEQVVMNLAVNARDAMPKGGRLTIDLNKVNVSPQYLQYNPDGRPGDFVCLQVADTGCGMSPETLSHIFEPFYTTKEVGKGTGLGLATVFGVVKQHEGWVDVDSQPGRGSTFSIFFPATDVVSRPRTQEPTPSPEVRGGRETILLVEDESTLRDMAVLILQERGYTVLSAANGKEAIAQWKLNQDHIDVVVTDMVMPEGLTGMELADRLFADRPGLKMLFTSGYSMEDIGAELVRHPHTRFLEKPYTSQSLAQAVREILDAPSDPPPATPADRPSPDTVTSPC